MGKMSRGDVLRKCIVVFDAIKRVASQGNAGLLAREGKEKSFDMDCEICETLREMLRELEGGVTAEDREQMRDWQKIAENGPPERMVF